jgi:uncharacterized protein (DUF427 family)
LLLKMARSYQSYDQAQKKILMATAIAKFKGDILAESNDTVIIEDHHYFPQDSVRKEFLRDSNSHTTCPWKGKAFYQHIEVNGDVIHNGAWFYPHPSTAAATVDRRIAFGDEITIHEN